jgi:hypothetical protein
MKTMRSFYFTIVEIQLDFKYYIQIVSSHVDNAVNRETDEITWRSID